MLTPETVPSTLIWRTETLAVTTISGFHSPYLLGGWFSSKLTLANEVTELEALDLVVHIWSGKNACCRNIWDEFDYEESASFYIITWRHNDHDGASNHQPHGCLLNRLFGRKSKKTSKLRVTGLCVGTSTGPANSPHKGPVTRKMIPFDDVIMYIYIFIYMRIMDHFMTRSIMASLGSFCKLKPSICCKCRAKHVTQDKFRVSS